jgi:hypothetical protein
MDLRSAAIPEDDYVRELHGAVVFDCSKTNSMIHSCVKINNSIKIERDYVADELHESEFYYELVKVLNYAKSDDDVFYNFNIRLILNNKDPGYYEYEFISDTVEAFYNQVKYICKKYKYVIPDLVLKSNICEHIEKLAESRSDYFWLRIKRADKYVKYVGN